MRSIVAAALACTWLFALPAFAQAPYPSKPVRVIVPLPAGGLADGFARLLAQHLADRMGQPVFVENRAGANQVIAGEVIAKSAPDGYTVGLVTENGVALATLSQKALPYDPVRDFSPISQIFIVPYYLVVHPAVPAKNLQELMSWVKGQGGKVSYASLGIGSSNHIAGEVLKSRFNADMTHVPYKGTAQAMQDLVANQVQVMFSGGQTAFPLIKGGKLRAIAVSGLKRSESMPDLPTVAESGIPGFEIVSWFGLVGPAGVPRPIVDRLNAETRALVLASSTKEKYSPFGIDMAPSTPEELGERIRTNPGYWKKIMEEAGVKPE